MKKIFFTLVILITIVVTFGKCLPVEGYNPIVGQNTSCEHDTEFKVYTGETESVCYYEDTTTRQIIEVEK
jgi:hypothetical protein